MNDTALSISTKALQPTYGKGQAVSGRGAWERSPSPDGAAPPPQTLGREATNAVVNDRQAYGLDETQAVNPSQRAEIAANETAKQQSPRALPGEGELEKAVESINDFLQSNKRSLEFSVDETSGRTVIKVWDAENEKVIRQIPPETALELMEKLRDGDGFAATGVAEKA
ncbi:flagellar protein FlaG [Thiorhodovibrio litoralis]|uniref:flagellar protein FlaG n=1 Tax=Thiorhodovibrio litoralis TaxID=2952932 RepID=UPI002B2620A7|nr:flagellar protein FlaG [Thiorhodovibrio litoralis]WPL11578.1 flagellar protein FlaG [Thiorhodovibrio litoralis]